MVGWAATLPWGEFCARLAWWVFEQDPRQVFLPDRQRPVGQLRCVAPGQAVDGADYQLQAHR